MAPTFSIRTTKFKNNPLLGRKQFVCHVIHPGQANVSKADVCEKLATMYKVKDSKSVSVFGFMTNYGGGSSTGMGLIYESMDALKKFEPKYRLKRVDQLGGTVYEGRAASHGTVGRRNYKKLLGDIKKNRNKKKAEVMKSAGYVHKVKKFFSRS